MSRLTGSLLADHSIASLTGSSETLIEEAAERNFLLVENPHATDAIAINLTGGTAVINGAGSITIPAMKAFWMDTFVPTNKITVIGTTLAGVTCYTNP